MFAFQSARQAPLNARRVRRLAPIALCGFPLSFLLLSVSSSPSLGTSVGLVLGLACLALTMVIAMTGTNQVAAGLESRLDEFELQARLRAHSDAYRWFGALVSALLAFGFIAGMFGLTMSSGDDGFLGLFFLITGYGAILPSWFLARLLPAVRDEDTG